MKRTLVVLALMATATASAAYDMETFKRFDLNRDGYVDSVEVVGSVDLQGRFRDIDVDRDGRISADEMRAWIAKPDKLHPMRPSAPLNVHEQWREVQRRRAEAATAFAIGPPASPVVAGSPPAR